MAAAASPSTAPWKPVPKMPSTATSARASSRCSRAVENRCHRPPVTANRRKFAAAAPRISPGRAKRSAVTPIPQRSRYRAATKASPPLFPVPHSTTARIP